jgi:hypothetical protein
LRKENGNDISTAFSDGPPHRRADEKRHGPQASGTFGIDKRRRSRRVKVVERDVLEVAPRGKRLEECRWRRGGTVHEEAHSAAYLRHRFAGGDLTRFPQIRHGALL